MRKLLTAILICLSVICLMAATGCTDNKNSASESDNDSITSDITSGSTSESESESVPETPVEVEYSISVYLEELDGRYIWTAVRKTGMSGDFVVITAEIVEASGAVLEGYHFDETDGRNVLSGTLSKNEETTFAIYFKLNEYDVVFKNADGEILQSGKVKHGATPVCETTPVKAADKKYSYVFKSWDKEIAECTENATYTAVYTAEFIDYSVTFDFANDEEALVTTYHYGDTVTVPENPTKDGYTFIGWDKEIAETCEDTVTYTAVYAENVTYTVKHYRRNVFGYVTLIEEETKDGHKLTDINSFAKEYDGIVLLEAKAGETDDVAELYYGLEDEVYHTPDFTSRNMDYVEKGRVTDGDNIYNNVYEATVSAGTAEAFLTLAYGDNSGKWLLIPIKQNYGYVGGNLQVVDGKNVYHSGNDYPLWFDKNGNAVAYSDSYKDWLTMAIYLDEADYPADGALNLNLFVWRLGTVQIGEFTYITQDRFNEMFRKTYSRVNHYVRNINGSFTLAETETDVTCIVSPTAKTYDGRVYGGLNTEGSVCDMYYELEGITFNVPKFTATGFDGAGSYAAKGTIVNEDGTIVYNNVYEAVVNSGAGEARLNIGYGNNSGKWLLLPVKQVYTLVNSELQFIDGKGEWHTSNSYPRWFDKNGAEITYDKDYAEWKIMAVYLNEENFPANAALNVNFFLWNLGTVQLGEYAFVTQEQFNELFGTTYSAVNHYVRNINGSFTLAETETNVNCVGIPAAKTYDGRVYASAKISDSVCDMYYELDGISFNVPKFTATGYDGYGSYIEKGRVTDGEAIYDNVYESSVTSGTSSAFLSIGYGNNSGKWLLLPVKQAYTYVGGDLQFVDGKNVYHNANDYPKFFDKNGTEMSYDENYTDWMIMAIYLGAENYPENGNLNVNLFVWRLGTVQIGEYAFVTQAQFDALLTVSQA